MRIGMKVIVTYSVETDLEILRLIFEAVLNDDKPSLCSAARCCQAWKGPALDLIWRRLPSAIPLLSLLPGFSTENDTIVRPFDSAASIVVDPLYTGPNNTKLVICNLQVVFHSCQAYRTLSSCAYGSETHSLALSRSSKQSQVGPRRSQSHWGNFLAYEPGTSTPGPRVANWLRQIQPDLDNSVQCDVSLARVLLIGATICQRTFVRMP